MRSSSADRALPLADRAGWTRLGVAVLLGLVAAAGPVVGRTSAQFTDTDEVAVVTVGTPDDFANPTPGPTSSPTSGPTSGTTTGDTSESTSGSTGSGPSRPEPGSPSDATPAGPAAGPGGHGPRPQHHSRVPLVR